VTQSVVVYNRNKITVSQLANEVSQAVGSFQSDAVEVSNLQSYSIFANIVGTFTGDVYVEATTKQSDSDVVNWFLITTSYTALTNSTEVLFDASIFAYTHIRVCVTVATGSATLTINASLKRP